MSKKAIQIDQEKCIGCSLCADTCKQSAIEMVDGKATVVREDYCDGIGNCLPVCPVGAISFVDQETEKPLACGCPGTHSKSIIRSETKTEPVEMLGDSSSQLNQWPVQIKLVPEQAPYFENAHLLIAADCTAFAYGSIHRDYMKNKVTIVGCPKLDEGDYTDKLTTIITENNIKSVTVIRMEVPCCGGLEVAVKNALVNSKKMIPWQVVTISVDGKVIYS